MTRDEKGRFLKGHEKIGGCKSKASEQSYLAIMLDVVSPDDFREIVVKARDQAKRGDAIARKWLSDYILGVPVQRTELSGPDGEPLRFIEKVVNAGDESA